MKGDKKHRSARPLSDLVPGILDPALRKKAGISVALLQNWRDIAGSDVAQGTRPLKIDWPKRGEMADDFQPGTLVLACDQSVVLKILYRTGEIVSRLNSFFGYAAVHKVRIVQRHVPPFREPVRHREKQVDAEKARHIANITKNIDDPELRKSLERLGNAIAGENTA